MLRRFFACPVCDNRLTRTQTLLGWLYLPLHFLVIPVLAAMFVHYAPGNYTDVTVNKIYFGLGTAFVLIALGEWLRRNFYVLLDSPGRFVMCLAAGFAVNWLLSVPVTAALLLLESLGDNPNNAELAELAETDVGAMVGLIVFLAPIVEESIFRGVVFGSIRPKSRVAAYAVSIALFSLLHVWQYVVAYGEVRYFIYMLQYLPVSFVLAWLYERSGSVWTSIAFHAAFNALSVSVMRIS